MKKPIYQPDKEPEKFGKTKTSYYKLASQKTPNE